MRVIFDLDVSPPLFAQSRLGTLEEIAEALKLVDVLKPCKAAASELTGEDDYQKIARKLLTLGPKIVAITMGSEGCLIASGEANGARPSIHREGGGYHRRGRRLHGRAFLRPAARLGPAKKSESSPTPAPRSAARGWAPAQWPRATK